MIPNISENCKTPEAWGCLHSYKLNGDEYKSLMLELDILELGQERLIVNTWDLLVGRSHIYSFVLFHFLDNILEC